MEPFWNRRVASAGMYSPLNIVQTQAQDTPQHYDYNVPFMRTSATVRRHQHEDVFSTASAEFCMQEQKSTLKSQTSATVRRHQCDEDAFPSTGSCIQQHKMTLKSDAQSSADLSSNIDRQFALQVVNSLTTIPHTKKSSETSGPSKFKRVRPDLPEPSKLRKKRKKLGKTWSSHAATSFSEHQNQLRHICLDFNWGKPITEVHNKQKPEQAVATARRHRLEPAAGDVPVLPPWEPRSGKDTESLVYNSGKCLDVFGESDGKKWTTGVFQEKDIGNDEKIPSYLLPPKQPRFLPKPSHNIPPYPYQSPHFMEDASLRGIPDDDNDADISMASASTLRSTPSATVSSSPYNTSDWVRFWKTLDTSSPPEALRVLAEDPAKSKFVEE